MKATAFFILLMFIIRFSTSQTPIDNFFQALIYDQETLKSYVDPDELLRSERLGINYTGIKNKFMISYDIDDSIKSALLTRSFSSHEYTTTVLETNDEFSKVKFDIARLNYSKIFYFKSGKYISPTTYYSRNWATDTSKYFIFKISDPVYFNKYCENKLDEFVDKMADMLQYTDEEKQLLQKEKIYYLLCKDPAEIKAISGFDMRGQYLTAFDEILTTYNTHFHELSHFLMNYKLKNLSLYTLPFFMEGYAVAMGGRGGLAARVVTDIGLYLQVKGIVTYDSILTNDGFYNEDASLTYPVSGLYTLFLMKTLGMDSYLELYKKVNGNLDFIKNIKASDLNIPAKSEFEKFLEEYEKETPISLDYKKEPYNVMKITIDGNILYTKLNFIFNLKNNLTGLLPLTYYINKDYKSKIFNEIAKKNYNGEMYLIKVDETYIKIYNCLSNELIAEYEKNFSLDDKPVPTNTKVIVDDVGLSITYFDFCVAKSIFDIEFTIK